MVNLTKQERNDGREYYTIEVGRDGRETDICEILQETRACSRLSGGSCKTCVINRMINRLAKLEHDEVPSLKAKFKLLDEYRRCWNCDFFEGQPGCRCLNKKSSYFAMLVGSTNCCGKFLPQRRFDQIVGKILQEEEKQG